MKAKLKKKKKKKELGNKFLHPINYKNSLA